MPVAKARPIHDGKPSLPYPENPANCGVFAFWLWTSVRRPSPLFGEKLAKFSLSFSGPVDFPIVKSTGWFSCFLVDQRFTCGLGRAVLWRQCLSDGIRTVSEKEVSAVWCNVIARGGTYCSVAAHSRRIQSERSAVACRSTAVRIAALMAFLAFDCCSDLRAPATDTLSMPNENGALAKSSLPRAI